MNLKQKKILLISPETWGINYVSKHHYALHLAKKDNQVYFLNLPSNENIIRKIDHNLWIVNYKTNYRGLRFLPIKISGRLIRNEIIKLEKRLKIKFDLIWNFDSSRFFNLSCLNNKLRIAHIVDWSEDFNRETLCRTSDICFCTSDKLLKAMRKYNQYTYNIGHGYAPSEYELNPEEKKEVGNKFQIKAGYIGNMNSKYLDWETFYLLASKNPEIGFFFIGPKGMSNLSGIEFNEPLLTKLEKLDNTFFLGEKPAYKIPSYLKEFDILLLIYKAKKYKEQVANPHKLLEYFGSGKIVLASWTEEYRDKNDLIEMVPSNDDLPTTFTKVMNNIKFHNQNDKQLKRKKFAMDNSYEKKIHVIENLINEFIL